jgi:hypothetical protein
MGGLLMKRWGRSVSGGVPGNDPYWSNVKLLLGFGGADGSTTVTDESPVARGNATVGENSQIDTAQFKYGTSSLLLDGNLDEIWYADSADWLFTSSDQFTIECWVRFNDLTGYQPFVSHWDSQGVSDQSWVFDKTSAGLLRFAYSTTGADVVQIEGAWGPSTGTWYHVAADCDAAHKLRVYVNGSMVASGTGVPTFHNCADVLRIGSTRIPGTDNFLNGWLDELRITKGVARYASDGGFSVPTAAFPRS